MLPDVANVTAKVVPPSDLRERFLESVVEACTQGNRNHRPVLIMIFTHSKRNNSLIIGGDEGAGTYPQIITSQMFADHVRRRSPISPLTLLTTASFGGGWAINPQLNISLSIATQRWTPSLAWPPSGTVNRRICGPESASAIAESLVRTELGEEVGKLGEEIGELEEEMGELEEDEDQEWDELREVPEFAALTAAVRDVLVKID